MARTPMGKGAGYVTSKRYQTPIVSPWVEMNRLWVPTLTLRLRAKTYRLVREMTEAWGRHSSEQTRQDEYCTPTPASQVRHSAIDRSRGGIAGSSRVVLALRATLLLALFRLAALIGLVLLRRLWRRVWRNIKLANILQQPLVLQHLRGAVKLGADIIQGVSADHTAQVVCHLEWVFDAEKVPTDASLLGGPVLVFFGKESASANGGDTLDEVELSCVPPKEADEQLAHAVLVERVQPRHRLPNKFDVRVVVAVELPPVVRVHHRRRLRVRDVSECLKAR
mmetsp:Transcript_1102/g.2642  ORF Transcript_1102/g.2642 Transcript_1102/m.2642 type:complete len:280 (+) Transcript_1102:456-1295(+)